MPPLRGWINKLLSIAIDMLPRWGIGFMNLIRLLLLVTLLIGCTGAMTNSPDVQQQKPDLSPYFKETEGCFVLYDLKRASYTRYNEARCRVRFNPKSTFK